MPRSRQQIIEELDISPYKFKEAILANKIEIIKDQKDKRADLVSDEDFEIIKNYFWIT